MKLIKDVLLGDTTSFTKEQVYAANSSGPNPMFTDVSDVDPYMHLCLKDLMSLGTGLSDLDDLITWQMHTDNVRPEVGINIAYASMEANESPSDDYLGNDDPNAEYGLLKVLSRVNPVTKNKTQIPNLPEQLDLRVRYFLDTSTRARTRIGTKTNPFSAILNPEGFDNSINANFGVYVRWRRFGKPNDVLEVVSIYNVWFVRNFPVWPVIS